MTNLITRFLGSGIAPVAAERAPERYRQREYDGKGLVKQRLLPAQQAELNAKLAVAAKDRDTKLDTLAEARDKALKEAKADYDARVRNIERENRQLQHKANLEFDEIETKLLDEVSAPLSVEQVALLMAKPGEVVRVPSPAPSAALPQGV